jgi:uncharacterized membrane protein YfcA
MSLITDPFFYVLAIPAVLIYGMGKGGLGGATGAISVPLMAMAIDPLQAAVILLPIICVMDLHTIVLFRNSFDRSILKIILPASVVGIGLGSLLLGSLDASYIKLLLGTIAVLFCLHHWLSFTVAYSESRDRLIGNFWGLVAGFTSTHIHAGGPPISIYLLPKQLDKVVLIGTLAMFFAVMNFIKLVPYSLLGQFNTINLWTSVVLMPLAPIGVSMGFWLLHHVKQEVLYRVIYVFLFGSGVKLVYDGLLNLVV